MYKLKYSYMTNMWGQNMAFKKINNFEEWYEGDFNRAGYYKDWDSCLRYMAGAGFTGIELMWFNLPQILNQFGSYENFNEFIRERGIEKVTGIFGINFVAENKQMHENIFRSQQKLIDALAAFGGSNLVLMPAGQYYGTGPLSKEGLQNCVDCMNEIGRRARAKGLWASIHNEFWCAINLKEHRPFLEATDPENVAYCMDTAQITIMGEDILDFYDTYHDRVKFLHLKDTVRPKASDEDRFAPGAEFDDSGRRWFYEVGRGKIDFIGLWKLMKKHGYEGWVSIESDGTPDPAATTLLVSNYINTVLKPIYS
jgi:inosose dehydratase